ncbi:hypothetical protein ACFTAO_00760 [Paenibacillus rhizoplanae]
MIEDEPYYFEQHPHFETTVLAEYPHDGAMRPAAWCHTFGEGRVVYLMPGHHLPSFFLRAAAPDDPQRRIMGCRNAIACDANDKRQDTAWITCGVLPLCIGWDDQL